MLWEWSSKMSRRAYPASSFPGACPPRACPIGRGNPFFVTCPVEYINPSTTSVARQPQPPSKRQKVFHFQENNIYSRHLILSFLADDLKMVRSPSFFRHPLIGLGFDRFDGRQYVPNAEKRANYPDDDAAAQSLLNVRSTSFGCKHISAQHHLFV